MVSSTSTCGGRVQDVVVHLDLLLDLAFDGAVDATVSA